jgi:hypothetical protein
MFSNLKTSDWIAAAISGITPIATSAIGNLLNKPETPAPGTGNSVLDYAGNVVGNLDVGGFKPLSPIVTAGDPVRTWAEMNEAEFEGGIDVKGFVGSTITEIPGQEAGVTWGTTESVEPAPVEPIEPVTMEGQVAEPVTLESQPIEVQPWENAPMPTARTGDDPTSLPLYTEIK